MNLRQHDRQPSSGDTVVTYRHLARGPARSGIAQTKDICAGGLRFTAPERFEAGTALQVSLRLLPNASPLSVDGEVVWTRPLAGAPGVYEHGMKFSRPPAMVIEALNAAATDALRAPVASPGAERRRAPRALIDLPIQYRAPNLMVSAWYSGVIKDLSATGLRLLTTQAWPLGQALDFQITTPIRKEPYTARGELVSEYHPPNATIHDYGVRFIDLTPKVAFDLAQLVRFVSSARPLETGA